MVIASAGLHLADTSPQGMFTASNQLNGTRRKIFIFLFSIYSDGYSPASKKHPLAEQKFPVRQ
jgi:hypothetical protein